MVAISFSRGSSLSRDRTRVFRIAGRRFNLCGFISSSQKWLHLSALPLSVTENSCCTRSCQFLIMCPCSGVWFCHRCVVLSHYFLSGFEFQLFICHRIPIRLFLNSTSVLWEKFSVVFLYVCAFFHLCINRLFKSSCLSHLMSRSPVSLYLLLFCSWFLPFDLDCRWALEKAMAPHSSTLAWKILWMEEPGRLQSMGSVTESRIRLSDFTFTFHLPTLEKEMATHSSVLAWRIPGTGEPGGLLSMGSHRVGHD